MGAPTASRPAVATPRLVLAVAILFVALGTSALAEAVSAAPHVVSLSTPAQVGGPPGPGGPPGAPPGVGPVAIPPFVLQILRAVLPAPVLQLLQALGVLQPASP